MIVLSLNVISLQVCKFIGNVTSLGKNIYQSWAAVARICKEVVDIADKRMIEFDKDHITKRDTKKLRNCMIM
jgi:hypothetical protein